MNFIKKLSLYVCIILFVMSIYKDVSPELRNENEKKNGPIDQPGQFQIIKVKVQSGETVLSIVEDINQPLTDVDVESIILDFQALNPTTDPYQLKTGAFYYFPLYRTY